MPEPREKRKSCLTIELAYTKIPPSSIKHPPPDAAHEHTGKVIMSDSHLMNAWSVASTEAKSPC